MLNPLVLLVMAVLSGSTLEKILEITPKATCPNLTQVGNREDDLERLLQTRLNHPEQAEVIDAQIRQTFEQRCAVLVLDSSGFSRLTHEQGIIVALAEIERMRQLVEPLVETHSGLVFKADADNVYAVFPSTQMAIDAAQAILAQPLTAQVSLGIGFGDLITLSGDSTLEQPGDRPIVDVYGEEMNLASKLGEDLAEHGEILLTPQAFAQLSPQLTDLTEWERVEHQISGLTLSVYRWSIIAGQ